MTDKSFTSPEALLLFSTALLAESISLKLDRKRDKKQISKEAFLKIKLNNLEIAHKAKQQFEDMNNFAKKINKVAT